MNYFTKALLLIFLYFILIKQGNAQSTSVFDASYFNRDNLGEPPIKIGKGFHINDIYKQTRSCFTSESTNQNKLTSQQTGGKKTNIRIFYTKDNLEYNDFKSKGASGQVNFLNLFTLSGQKLEEYSNQKLLSEEKIIFQATVDFGIFSFTNEPILTLEAKKLITDKKIKEFVNLYGTHYISGIRKASSISVILTRGKSKFSNSSNSNKNVNGKAIVPLKGNGSFEIESNNSINDLLENNKFTVSIEINGPSIDASNIQNDISNILNGTENDKSAAISNIINGSMKNISNPSQASITQYYYSPFSLYGLDGIYWDFKKQNQLAKINEAVIKIYSIKSKTNNLISPSGKQQIEEFYKNERVNNSNLNRILDTYESIIPALKNINSEASKYLSELEAKYEACSDIYCSNYLTCCNNETYLNDLPIADLSTRVRNELDKFRSEISKQPCEINQKGILEIQNTSRNPYNIYSNGQFIETIPGNTNKSYFVGIGNYSIKAVQKTGYLVYPTENIRNATIRAICDKVVLKIGFLD